MQEFEQLSKPLILVIKSIFDEHLKIKLSHNECTLTLYLVVGVKFERVTELVFTVTYFILSSGYL